MAKIKGVCKNIEDCNKAMGREVQELEKSAPFVCEECGKPLFESTSGDPGTGSKRWLRVVLPLAVVALGAGGSAFFLLGNDDSVAPTPTDPIVITEPEAIATPKPEAIAEPTAEPISASTTQPQSIATSASDQLDLGYAVWTGNSVNGKPNDTNGRMTFKSRRLIDSRDDKERYAEAGDYIMGEYKNGKLIQGRWHKKDGNIEQIYIGE